MILSHALKHKKAQAHAPKPAPFVIQPGIAKELTSMMQTWLMNEAPCPPAIRQEPDKDAKILQWLSIHAGLTSECVSEVIEPFAKQQAENTMNGNEAAKHVAARQVM